MSRICEEFQCLPSQALQERDRVPTGLLEDVIEARAYAQAKAVYERDPRAQGDLIQMVQLIEFGLAEEELRGRE